MINGAVKRVDLDVLDAGLYGLAFNVQNRLNATVTNSKGGFVDWQLIRAVARACTVDYCWDLAVATEILAGSALTEIGAYYGVKVYRCHDDSP